MRSFRLFLILIPLISPVHAEEVNFVEASQQVINNSTYRSPVYIKKAYLKMYEEDTKAYGNRLQQLDQQKSAGKISQKEYLQRTEVLKKAYQDLYDRPLSEMSEEIKNHPVDAFYRVVAGNKRRNLLKLTHPDFHQDNMDYLEGRRVPPIPQEMNPAQEIKKAIDQFEPSRQLGRKNIPINLSAFE